MLNQLKGFHSHMSCNLLLRKNHSSYRLQKMKLSKTYYMNYTYIYSIYH